MNTDFHNHLTNMRTLTDAKATAARKARNKQNNTTKDLTSVRNQLNKEVKKTIAMVKELRKERDGYNQSVRDLKKARKACSEKVKETKREMNTNPSPRAKKAYEASIKSQTEAHERLKEEATLAQSKHDEMLERNKEAEELRKKAERAHKGLRQSKKEADKHHMEYMVALRCMFSCQDMLRTLEQNTTAQAPDTEEALPSQHRKKQHQKIESSDDHFENAGL